MRFDGTPLMPCRNSVLPHLEDWQRTFGFAPFEWGHAAGIDKDSRKRITNTGEKCCRSCSTCPSASKRHHPAPLRRDSPTAMNASGPAPTLSDVGNPGRRALIVAPVTRQPVPRYPQRWRHLHHQAFERQADFIASTAVQPERFGHTLDHGHPA